MPTIKLGGIVNLTVEPDKTGAFAPDSTIAGRIFCKSYIVSPGAWLIGAIIEQQTHDRPPLGGPR